MDDDANKPSVAIDSEPPIALDKFIEQSGLSAVTLWRYRRVGWLNTLNICGRHYLTRSEIARFNARAAAGEFAKEPTKAEPPPLQSLRVTCGRGPSQYDTRVVFEIRYGVSSWR